jgi:hypothetical protein
LRITIASVGRQPLAGRTVSSQGLLRHFLLSESCTIINEFFNLHEPPHFFTTPEPHNTQPPTPLVEFHSYSRDMTPQVIRNQRTATYLHTACCRSGSPAYRTHTSLLAKHAEKIRILGRRDAARSWGRAALPIYMSIALNSANVIWDLSTNPRTFCLTARAVQRACFRMSRHTQNTAGRHRYKEAFLSDVAD